MTYDSPTDETEPEPESFNDLYGRLDSTGGLLNTVSNATHAMRERGYFTESIEDKLADVDNHLQRAFDELDSDEIDATAVSEECHSAHRTLVDVKTMASHTGFTSEEVPDHVDASGTMWELLQWAYNQTQTIAHLSDQWRRER